MQQKVLNNQEDSLLQYCLHLADSSLIMGHRLSEWTGHGPSLEQDIALTNIALDLIGQARNFYQYAATLSDRNSGNVTEDSLAFLRDAHEFRNLLITELPNGHWGNTLLKIFFYSTWQFYLYQKLVYFKDVQIAAIAEKSLKEVSYHARWSSGWIKRLGDGTTESHQKMQEALEDIWSFTGEMFQPSNWEKQFEQLNVLISFDNLQKDWIKKIKITLEEATLSLPSADNWMHSGGKSGIHTEHLGYILAEMQFLQRAYPGCEW